MENVRTKKDLFGSTAASNKGAGRQPQLQFAIQVNGYSPADNPTVVHGLRLDTNEEINITLRPYENKGTFKRNEIKDFAAPARTMKNKSATSVGGALLVQGAIDEGNGNYSAHWMTSLVPDANSGYVITNALLQVTATEESPSPDKPEKERQWRGAIDILPTARFFSSDYTAIAAALGAPAESEMPRPTLVSSMSELRQKMIDVVTLTGQCGVRVSNEDSFDALNMWAPKDKETFKPTQVEESVDKFLKIHNESFKKLIESGYQMEVIPVARLGFGKPAITSDMLRGPNSNYARFTMRPKDGSNADWTANQRVFAEGIVALRLSDQGRWFVASVHRNGPAYGVDLKEALCYVDTEHLQPNLATNLSLAAVENVETEEFGTGDMVEAVKEVVEPQAGTAAADVVQPNSEGQVETEESDVSRRSGRRLAS